MKSYPIGSNFTAIRVGMNGCKRFHKGDELVLVGKGIGVLLFDVINGDKGIVVDEYRVSDFLTIKNMGNKYL